LTKVPKTYDGKKAPSINVGGKSGYPFARN
jgi:hypothetical protein